MTRYVTVFIIMTLFAPSLAVATASPTQSLPRAQQISMLEAQLRVLRAEYERLLAQKNAGYSSPTVAPTTASLSRAKNTTLTTYNAPLMTNDATKLEELVLAYSNDARRQNGLGPLSRDAALVALARGHSDDMLENNYFNHKDLSGCNSICRMNKSGYPWQEMGENIHQMSGYTLSISETAHKIVNDWMNSPSHRANLLNPAFTKAGVGIAQDGLSIYSTTEYALPW